MDTTKQARPAERVLGYGGLLLALAGTVGILYLSDIVTDAGSNPTLPVAIALIFPLLLSLVLMLLPPTRDNSLIWLVTGAWCGVLAALTIFSVGIIFLVATVLLLAAFLKANWGN